MMPYSGASFSYAIFSGEKMLPRKVMPNSNGVVARARKAAMIRQIQKDLLRTMR